MDSNSDQASSKLSPYEANTTDSELDFGASSIIRNPESAASEDEDDDLPSLPRGPAPIGFFSVSPLNSLRWALDDGGDISNGAEYRAEFIDGRVDDSDMSYEDMIAIGDRIGSQNISLTEREVSEILETHIWQLPTNVDEQCSICLVEYDVGDELGKLRCEHMFHVDCITKWLRIRNVCPLCKSCASPP